MAGAGCMKKEVLTWVPIQLVVFSAMFVATMSQSNTPPYFTNNFFWEMRENEEIGKFLSASIQL